jgi:(S)-2-hydroxy-acid oxidase
MQEQQLRQCVCAEDFRDAARKLMRGEVFEYIDSGSEDEKTLKENSTSFHRLMIVPRVLTSSTTTDLSTSLFGRTLALPFGFAPWAMNALSHPHGELVPAAVARNHRIVYSLSTLSTKSYAEVAQANGDGLRMMQMYISNDWALTETQVRLAEKYGFSALAITVDAQVLGIRKREVRTALDTSSLSFPVLEEIQKCCEGCSSHPKDRKALLANRDLSMTWETIKRIRGLSKLKIVLKGIMHPKDAVIALDYCDAIWVSNHGGRQLDGISSTINILPLIKAAVGDRIPLLIDGGVRTGNDIFKCLALGATYVLVARPLAYSLVFG